MNQKILFVDDEPAALSLYSENAERQVCYLDHRLQRGRPSNAPQSWSLGWESTPNETVKRVEVEIHQEPTRHIVDVPKLGKWVGEKSMYPAQEPEKQSCGNYLVHVSTAQRERILAGLA